MFGREFEKNVRRNIFYFISNVDTLRRKENHQQQQQILFTNIISFPKNIRKEIREKK